MSLFLDVMKTGDPTFPMKAFGLEVTSKQLGM